MNNFFDIKRFGSYLRYELGVARNNYLWSGIICGLSPLILFMVMQMVAFMFSGDHSAFMANGYAIVAAMITIPVVIITFPMKMYGQITEKRYGSSWLLRPASSFEKWLSIILMTCVIVPLTITAIFLASDSLLSLVFHKAYGNYLLGNIYAISNEFVKEPNGLITLNLIGLGFTKWCQYILIFTLGALIFKTSKVGKTIIALIVLWMITSTFSSIFLLGHLSTLKAFAVHAMNNDFVQGMASLFSWTNIAMNLYILTGLTITGGALYYRIRTLKH